MGHFLGGEPRPPSIDGVKTYLPQATGHVLARVLHTKRQSAQLKVLSGLLVLIILCHPLCASLVSTLFYTLMGSVKRKGRPPTPNSGEPVHAWFCGSVQGAVSCGLGRTWRGPLLQRAQQSLLKVRPPAICSCPLLCLWHGRHSLPVTLSCSSLLSLEAGKGLRFAPSQE